MVGVGVVSETVARLLKSDANRAIRPDLRAAADVELVASASFFSSTSQLVVSCFEGITVRGRDLGLDADRDELF